MKGYSILILALALILFSPRNGLCQMLRCVPDKPVVCYYNHENRPDRVGVTDKFKSLRTSAGGRAKSAVIEVVYVNFPEDNLAKQAFQYAIDIWESELSSPVPIHIRAEWADLESGVLATAIWGSAYANFGGEQYRNTFYPVALAEKIAGRELNDPAEPDISASFSRNVAWYLGTDGLTPNGKMDLVTIVLHEIAHGLGITDTYTVNGADGTVGLLSGGDAVPFIFDAFVENGPGETLLRDFASPSTQLAAALQSDDVFFNGALAVDALTENRPRLYAPTIFDKGSSISHLDENTFNDPADANRLMTPRISPAESIHDPGDVLRAMFSDMGWVGTRIDHHPLKDTERKDGQPYTVQAFIRSDNGYDPNTVALHYSTDGTTFTTVAMTPAGVADEFKSSLPGTTVDRVYAYYISVVDDTNRVFTDPGKLYERGKPVEQATHIFSIGPDLQSPEITHKPLTYVFDTDPALEVSADVSDNQGVDEVVLEYVVNGGAPQTRVMSAQPATDHYSAVIPLPALQIGDVIAYRIAATDVAGQQNASVLPADGYYMIAVTGIMAVRDAYVNDFDDGRATDFYGAHFSITTPDGFANPAIHSDHPYPNGSVAGPDGSTWRLQVPIRINDINPVIRFDEVVLVEPGAAASQFGDENFFDYVVVEGSVDDGVTWKPFAAGYDCRANSVWLARYNAVIIDNNSQASGDSTLYRSRKIDMLENKEFKPGDVVLLRFRVFADQLGHGWGWAIDNLSIQTPVTDTEDPRATSFSVYPVPVRKELYISVQTPAQAARFEIFDLSGKLVFAETFGNSPQHVIRESIDMRGFSQGIYILKATVGDTVYRRRIVRVY